MTRNSRLALALGAVLMAGCAGGANMSARDASSGGAPDGMKAEGAYPTAAASPMAPSADYEEAASESAGYPKKNGGNSFGSPAPAPPPAPGEPAPTEIPGPGSERQRTPLLIYEAVLTLAVFETPKQLEAIEKQAAAAGGYLVRRSDAEITVRVPAQAFGASLESIAKLGDELHREIGVKDVTAQFTDLEARLKNARAVRDRLQELLSKAAKVEEALAVERELARVSGEIESMLGQLKLMSELISFSTITVRFQPHQVDQVERHVNLPFPWLGELGLPHLLSL